MLAINEVDHDFDMQLVYPSTFMGQDSAKKLARRLELIMDVMIVDESKNRADEGLNSATVGDVLKVVEDRMNGGNEGVPHG